MLRRSPSKAWPRRVIVVLSAVAAFANASDDLNRALRVAPTVDFGSPAKRRAVCRNCDAILLQALLGVSVSQLH